MEKWRHIARGVVVGGVVLSAVFRAEADTNRFNLLIDYPPTLQSHFTTTPETPVLGRFQPYVGLQTDYSYRSLRVTDATTAATRPVVNHILAEYLYAAVGIAPRLQVGVVLPFLLQTSFIDPAPVVQPATIHKRGISDIRFDAAYNILDRSKYPVGLSLLGFVTAPTGPENEFLGNTGVTGGGQVIVDAAPWRQLHWSSALGVLFHKQIVFENLNVGQQLELAAGAAWDFMTTLSATTEFRLRTPFNNFMKNAAHTPMEARAGMDWRIGRSGVAVKPGVGVGLTYGSSQPLIRGLVAVTYTGVAQAPPSPRPPKPVKEAAPKAVEAPKPVLTKVVKVPKVPEPEVTAPKVVEAPKPVLTKVVEAPKVPEPEVTAPKVVEAPKPVLTKVVEAPKVPEPEVTAPKVVEAPKPQLANLIGDLPFIVRFAVGSAVLRPNAMSFSDTLLSLLQSPDVTIRIQGHSEPRLSPLETRRLSVQRARAVMHALVKRGANPARIRVVGLDGWLPAAFPDTKVSRRNIRVDFVVIPVENSR